MNVHLQCPVSSVVSLSFSSVIEQERNPRVCLVLIESMVYFFKNAV